MMKGLSIAVAALALVSLVGCAGFDDAQSDSTEPEHTGTAVAPIVNGIEQSTNSMAIASIYAKNAEDRWTFWCSGRVLNPRSNPKAILTAQHCLAVNPNGLSEGLVDPEQRLITGRVNPGYQPNNTSSGYQLGTRIRGHQDLHDIALIWVDGDINLPDFTYSVGLNPTPIEDLVDYGFDIYAAGPDDPDDPSTAGTVRAGFGFRVNRTWFDGEFIFEDDAYPDASTTRGDSGGLALWTYYAAPRMGTRSQIGVQVARGGPPYRNGHVAGIAAHWIWLRNELTYLYLRSTRYPGRRVYWPGLTRGTVLKTRRNSGEDWHSRLVYDPRDGTIRVWGSTGWSGKCIDLMNNDPTNGNGFWIWPCNGRGAQRFVMNREGQLELEAHPGKCLMESNVDHRLFLADCTIRAEQSWIFDHDPGD